MTSTTRIGTLTIAVGILLLFLRGFGVIDAEAWDIGGVICIVIGALAIAIDGEAADQGTQV
jgi:hypothetical protein